LSFCHTNVRSGLTGDVRHLTNDAVCPKPDLQEKPFRVFSRGNRRALGPSRPPPLFIKEINQPCMFFPCGSSYYSFIPRTSKSVVLHNLISSLFLTITSSLHNALQKFHLIYFPLSSFDCTLVVYLLSAPNLLLFITMHNNKPTSHNACFNQKQAYQSTNSSSSHKKTASLTTPATDY